MVFEQVMQEPFSLGKNKTGFIASFQYIFEPKNFQQYLERAQLRLKKQHHAADEVPRQAVGVIEADEKPDTLLQEEYERSMREYAAQHPDSRQARIVAEWDRKKQNEDS